MTPAMRSATARVNTAGSACALALLLILGVAADVHAQSSAPEGSDQIPIEFERDSYAVAELGLTLDLPVDTIVRNERYGSSVSITLTPPAIDGAIEIQSRRVTSDDLTTTTIGDSIVKQLNDAGGTVMARSSDLVVGDKRVDRFYVRLPRAERDTLPGNPVRGITIVEHSDRTFLVYSLVTRDEFFPDARRVYETIIATARYENPADIALSRHAALATGQRLLESITSTQFERVVTANADRWERLITPGPTGADSDDTEHGYRRIRAWFGQRGEMAEGKSPARFTAAERADGVLVRMVARIVDDQQIIDSRSVMFLSDDRDTEAWSIETLVRKRAADGSPSAFAEQVRRTEVGERDGDRISVRENFSLDEPTRVDLTIPDLGYLNRAEEILLPQLIVAAGLPSDAAFYSYRSETRSISLRTDSSTRSRAAAPVWSIETRLDPNRPGWTGTYGDDGRFLSVDLPGGRVWTPVTPSRLVELWSRKGLPVD